MCTAGGAGLQAPLSSLQQVKFLVPNVAAGSIIGKGGANITEIQTQSNARMQVGTAAGGHGPAGAGGRARPPLPPARPGSLRFGCLEYLQVHGAAVPEHAGHSAARARAQLIFARPVPRAINLGARWPQAPCSATPAELSHRSSARHNPHAPAAARLPAQPSPAATPLPCCAAVAGQRVLPGQPRGPGPHPAGLRHREPAADGAAPGAVQAQGGAGGAACGAGQQGCRHSRWAASRQGFAGSCCLPSSSRKMAWGRLQLALAALQCSLSGKL